MLNGRRNSDSTAATEATYFSSAEFSINPDECHPSKLLVSISTKDISPIRTEEERSFSDTSSKTSKNVLHPTCSTGNPIKSALFSRDITPDCEKPSRPANGNALQNFLANLPEIEDILSDSSECENEDTDSILSSSTRPSCHEVSPQATLKMNTALYQKKVVSFGSVNIRSYERILSDNPASTSGPSIGIGWAFAQEECTAVDEWDKERQGMRKQKRSKMVLSAKKRENLLLSIGYSDKEILEMVRKINKARGQRRNTVTNLDNQAVEEVVENARRKIKHALSLEFARSI
jgi:hypothetical protein